MNYALRLSKNENKGPLGEKEYFEDDEEEKRKVKELLEKIKTSEYIVVHSGAGISTSSGLQDFRGPTGIWTNESRNEINYKRRIQNEREKKKGEVKQMEKEEVKQRENEEEKIKTYKTIKGSLQGKYENLNYATIYYSSNNKAEPQFNVIKKEKVENFSEDDKIERCSAISDSSLEHHKRNTNLNMTDHYNTYIDIKNSLKSYSNVEEDCSHNSSANNADKSENGDSSDSALNSKNVDRKDKSYRPYLDPNYSYNDSKDKQSKKRNIYIKKENSSSNSQNSSSLSDNKNVYMHNSSITDEKTNITNHLKSDENYVIFGNRKKQIIDLHLALPTKTHIMIKELMNRNIIKYLITQNIDSLHYRCGTKFSKISEIHGNIFIERCDFCGRRYLRDFVISTISFKPTGSLCFLCSFPPVGICTDVLLDWNNAYEDFFHLNSIKHSQRADFHFCLGSSFYIVPASYYPSKKKFANENSYSCLINYQKSSLSKEVNLSLHSNVNDISDIIINEFSLDPLSVRNALIIVVRCQLMDFDLLCDELITVMNSKKDLESLREVKEEIKDGYNNNTEVDPSSKFSLNNNNNNSNQGKHFDQEGSSLLIDKKETLNNYSGYKKVSHDRDDKYFYGTNGGDVNSNNTDNNKKKINKYNNNNDTDEENYTPYNTISGNDGTVNEQKSSNNTREQLFLIKCSMIKNIKTVSLDSLCKTSVRVVDSNKGIWIIRTNYSCLLEIELWYNSFVLLKLNYNEHSTFIELNTWIVNVAYTHGDDIDDVDYFNNSKNSIRSFSLIKNKYLCHKNAHKFLDGNDCYESKRAQNENKYGELENNKDYNNDYDNRHNSNNNNDNNNNDMSENYSCCENCNKPRLEHFQISEILNEHVHVGYNPINIQPKSKVELLAILSNSNKMYNYNSYMPFELPNSIKLLYNLFCLINKSNKEKTNYTREKREIDKMEVFIKSLSLSKSINIYTSNFINLFIQKQKLSYQGHYTFRERKKRKLNDFSLCSSSDENKEEKFFIFYDLYMNEYKDLYKIKINKDLIKNNSFNYRLKNSYSEESNIIRHKQDLIMQEEINKLCKINQCSYINEMNITKDKDFIQNIEESSYSDKSSTENETIYNSYGNFRNVYNCYSNAIATEWNDNKLSSENYMQKNNNYYSSSNNNSMPYDGKAINSDILQNNYIGQNSCADHCKLANDNISYKGTVNNPLEKSYISTENKCEDSDCSYSHFLFCPTILISNKHKLGELVSKIPKYIKPQKIYTPYRKLIRDKKHSNTLQKCRNEIWHETYNDLINNINKEHIIDSTLYKEICYFPLWLLNYINDLFECL
ncbi:transcriptional regulatory protein sir2b [Plasmodium brasilianum]|uniref:Transcriptional regulatory protein sir2b n=1 Tax=Plasmodium brasilianum TaxID=5824 RepID=A0ACB9Y6G5_PLABR|nr:transcriptional regulatory protein sir2b [Plasmodium brasilianum]